MKIAFDNEFFCLLEVFMKLEELSGRKREIFACQSDCSNVCACGIKDVLSDNTYGC